VQQILQQHNFFKRCIPYLPLVPVYYIIYHVPDFSLMVFEKRVLHELKRRSVGTITMDINKINFDRGSCIRIMITIKTSCHGVLRVCTDILFITATTRLYTTIIIKTQVSTDDKWKPRVPTYLLTCLSTCLPTYLPIYLPTYIPTYL
jgi:hypothetical protein